MMYWLSLLIANGIIGSLVIWSFGSSLGSRRVALASSVLSLLIWYLLTQNMVWGSAELQLIERIRWIPYLNIEFILGIDGLSWSLISLTLLINYPKTGVTLTSPVSFLCLLRSRTKGI